MGQQIYDKPTKASRSFMILTAVTVAVTQAILATPKAHVVSTVKTKTLTNKQSLLR